MEHGVNWMTADAIAERYLVGEAKLLDYARRGNLPFRRPEQGATLFDETVCARFFRPRKPTAMSYREPSGPHMGILGVTRMGAPAQTTRIERRRSVRAAFETPEIREAWRALRKAG